MSLEAESSKLLQDTIRTIRLVSNEQLQISKVIKEVVKMQQSLSERMDQAEKENREEHKKINQALDSILDRLNGEAKVPPPKASGTLGVD